MLALLLALVTDVELRYHQGEAFEKAALSPDGRWLATNSAGGAVIYDASGRVVRTIEVGSHGTYALAFHPTRPELYLARQALYRVDVLTGQTLAETPTGTALGLGFDAAGGVLVKNDGVGRLTFADAKTLVPIPPQQVDLTLTFHGGHGGPIGVRHDGGLVFAAPPPRPCALDGRGALVFAAGGRIGVDDHAGRRAFVCDTGQVLAALPALPKKPFRVSNVSSAAISLDGSTAFLETSIVDLRTGAVLGALPDPALATPALAFSADGAALYSLLVSRVDDGSPNHEVFVRRWELATLRPTWTRSLGPSAGPHRAIPGRPAFLVGAAAPGRRDEYGHFEETSGPRPPLRRIDAERAEAVGSVAKEPVALSSGFGLEVLGSRTYGVKATALEGKRTVSAPPSARGASALVDGAAVSADGRLAVVGAYFSDKGGPGFWVFRDGRLVKTLLAPEPTSVAYALALDPAGRSFVAADLSDVLRRYPLDGSRPIDLHTQPAPFFAGFRPVLAFSPDGRRYAVSRGDGAIWVFDGATDQLVAKLVGHQGPLQGLAFHPTRDLLASAGVDGATILWDLAGAVRLVTLLSPSPDEYAAVAPDGTYLGSRGIGARLQIRRGLEVFPFESQEIARHRPDLVMARVGFARPGEIETLRGVVAKRARLAGLESPELEPLDRLPTMKLGELPRVSPTRQIELRVEAADSAVDLARVLTYVNGVPVGGAAGRRLSGRSWSGTIPVILSDGVNVIDVSAENGRGVESLRERRIVVSTAPREKRTLHVVAVGVSDYADDAHDLEYAAKDAGDLARVIAESLSGSFDAVRTHLLVDRAATRAAILDLPARLGPTAVDDAVVVFFAGHGVLDDALDYHFAPTDADFADPARQGVPYSAIEGLLDGVSARRKLLLMDTCFSGELDKPEATKALAQSSVKVALPKSRGVRRNHTPVDTLALLQQLFADVRRGTGAQIISSSAGGELAFESAEWKNGVFTHAVLDGLASARADRNGDGRITVRELHDHVVARVQALTHGLQRPTSRRENLTLDFALR